MLFRSASPWLPIALVVPGIYALAVVAASMVTGRRHGLGAVARLLVVFPTMHMAWGLGFLLARPTVGRKRTE